MSKCPRTKEPFINLASIAQSLASLAEGLPEPEGVKCAPTKDPNINLATIADSLARIEPVLKALLNP